MERLIKIEFGNSLAFYGQVSVGFRLAEAMTESGLNSVRVDCISNTSKNSIFFRGVEISVHPFVGGGKTETKVVGDFLAAIAVRLLLELINKAD